MKRIYILTNRGIEGAPDLVIEIISPSSLKRDKIDKLKTYAHFKIPEYWVVDPNLGAVEQYILTNERYELMTIFQNNENITSPNITCMPFTMKNVMDNIPRLD
ncbi:Uma2 family endonuclease [Lentibacillus sp. CBA3610]|uniref:Uma2 family endonuclease n=1 Tax=Lentibacillus sp. CBA3610 TaxID=2518176 RepID=UPI001595A8EB|nr:Uma2 family endonuclease [Lentibacillus sp. CBA3610]QKY70131.1 Uma2 family endonuclease [Lentibacillus sp. CBA3610]